ncbi:MAG: hypothetical protein R3F37_08990 [Candidatus Competibacteraceae bacterium]
MKSATFDQPGLVRVYCNIHSRMVGFIHVFAHPYFAVTDLTGRFAIEGIPPGTYLLKPGKQRSHETQHRAVRIDDQPVEGMLLSVDARGFKLQHAPQQVRQTLHQPGNGEQY